MIQAFVVQRFFRSVLVAGSWMMPRLPVNRPRVRDGVDVAERIDPVLEWHSLSSSSCPPDCVLSLGGQFT